MARRVRGFQPSSQHGDYTPNMPECVECERLRVSCIDAATELASAQQHLAQYRPSSDTSFPSIWFGCMQALAASRTLRDQMLSHQALHTAPPESERAAGAS